MKTKIKEIQDYFINKILSGEYEIKNISEYIVELLVDNEYNFIIWIANPNILESFKCYFHKLSFMDLQFTKEESIKLHDILLPDINKYKKEVLLKRKREELEELEKELS